MPLYQPNQTILNGKYKIEKQLGAGAFGEVYLVTHLDLGVHRAVKVAHRDMPGFGSTLFEEAFDRFRQEAQIGARLKHDNLIQVFDFYDGQDSLHLVMEYAAGGSLEDKLQGKLTKGETFSVEETITILKDIAAGLVVLHDKRNPIVHRDLKPSNILFEKNGQAKIADLGLAQVPGGLSQRSRLGSITQSHPGTPAYMSPEQENSFGMLRPASDVYSVGVIAFEMLAGVNYNMQPPGTELKEFREDVPEPTLLLLESMLKEDPKHRLWDGNKLVVELQGLTQPLQEKAPVAPQTDRIEPKTKTKSNDIRIETQQPQPEKGKEIESQAILNGLMNYGDSLPPEILSGVKAQEVVDSPPPDEKTPLPSVSSEAPAKKSADTTGPLDGQGRFQSTKPSEPVATSKPAAMPETKTQTSPKPLAGSQGGYSLGGLNQPLSVDHSETKKEDKKLNPLFILGAFVLIGIIIWGVQGTLQTQYPAPQPLTVVETVMVTSEPIIMVEGSESGSKINPKDGMEMVYVPAGSFMMGSESSDADDDEGPVREVYLDAFWIDKYEVTNAQYKQCVDAGGCDKPDATQKYNDSTFADHPVVYVDWYDAQTYCEWVGRDLPTEAQWEKAARGDDGRIYPWGEESPNANLLNYNQNVGGTSEAGSYPAGASPYDAMDMAGNVWEWVADWYEADYYTVLPEQNPQGPTNGTYRVLRGGSWNNNERNVRSSGRGWGYPEGSSDNLGFRCALSN